jgi:hypothetical protein
LLERFDDAIQDLSRAIELDPNDTYSTTLLKKAEKGLTR